MLMNFSESFCWTWCWLKPVKCSGVDDGPVGREVLGIADGFNREYGNRCERSFPSATRG